MHALLTARRIRESSRKSVSLGKVNNVFPWAKRIRKSVSSRAIVWSWSSFFFVNHMQRQKDECVILPFFFKLKFLVINWYLNLRNECGPFFWPKKAYTRIHSADKFIPKKHAHAFIPERNWVKKAYTCIHSGEPKMRIHAALPGCRLYASLKSHKYWKVIHTP